MEKLNSFSAGVVKVTFVCFFVMVVVSVVRLKVVLGVPEKWSIYPAAPSWILPFQTMLVPLLFLTGLLFAIAEYLLQKSDEKARGVYLTSIILFFVWCSAYGCFRVILNRAFYIGGVVWGFVQTVTVSFVYCESGWTTAGIAGYKVC